MGLAIGNIRGPDWLRRARCKDRSPLVHQKNTPVPRLFRLRVLLVLSASLAEKQSGNLLVTGLAFLWTCMADPMPRCLLFHVSSQ